MTQQDASLDTATDTSHPKATPRGSSSMFGRMVLVVLVALAGVTAGVIWHEPLAGLFTSNQGGTGDGSLWTCSMHPQVIQEKPGVCPICHMALTPLKVDKKNSPQSHLHPGDKMGVSPPGGERAPDQAMGSANGPERRIKYWWDPMLNPPYISDKPGKSPMGMDLIPVYEEELSAGSSVTIDPAIVQNMGVRVAKVTTGPLRRSIRAVGYLDEAEPNIHDINLRVSGWIERLFADTEGMHLEQGAPLFDLYSPELRVAVEEIIAARRARGSMPSDADGISKQTADTLYEASARKLELWGLDHRQVDALAKLDHAPRNITFISPITGHVTQKHIVEGAAVKAGDRILRLVDHSVLWLDVQVFEQHLPFIRMGQKVRATIASQPGDELEGEVIFIHPHVNMVTRTALVRIALPNPAMTLRPGMYATVKIEAMLAEQSVLVPREAVIDTGDRQIAFVTQQIGRFEPRLVKLGLSADGGMVQVLQGLAPGEVVVTSGQFLLDSESRLREAIQKFLNEKQQVGAPVDASRQAAPQPAASVPMATMQGTAEVDRVVAAYLKMTATLGAPQKSAVAVDPSELISATTALQGVLAGTPQQVLADNLKQAAQAIKGQPIEEQRKRFPKLSASVIAVVQRMPPTRAVGEQLFVMSCEMAPGGAGQWLQTNGTIANPFFANTMKECGEMVRTIMPIAEPQKAPMPTSPQKPQE